MAKHSIRRSKSEFFQSAAREYMRLHGVTEFDPEEVAAWMVETGQYKEQAYSVTRRCKQELTKALKAQRLTDAEGRDVRAMLPVRRRNEQGELFSTWSPIYEATPNHARLSLQQWRRSIRGESLLHSRTTVSWNDHNVHGAAIPLFDYDMNKDIAEDAMPSDYPDEKPDDDSDEKQD